MRKKIIWMLVTVLAVTAMFAGLGLNAEAASSTSSTYYYNLQKNTDTTFSIGKTLYLTQNVNDLTDEDYISYGFPSVLSAEVKVSNPANNAGNGYTGCSICNGGQTQNTAGHWHVVITKMGDLPFDSCNGCITYESGNKWIYNCYGGGWKNQSVYLYTCDSGSFTASDVTVNFDEGGTMTGATLFKGTPDAFTVPAEMIIIDSTVNYANGDYTQTATLNGIVITAVDSNAVFNAKLGNLGLNPNDEAAIKKLLADADSNADVERILAQAKALADLDADETAKLQAVENINGIDYSEKKDRTDDIKEEIEKAKKAILAVTDIGLIDGLKQGAINANTLTVEKAKAITEVEQAYKNELNKILDGDNGLDLSQQNFLALKLQSALSDAKSAINSASIDTVAAAKAKGLNEIALSGKKADAINGMKQAAETALQGLTPAEKTEWENRINAALNEAMNDVLYAADEGQVNKIVQDLQNELNTTVAKAKALTDVRAKAEAVKNAVKNELGYLEDADETALLQMVADELAKAEANIKNAADVPGVNAAKNNGNTELAVINKKANAINDIIKKAESEKNDVCTYDKLSGDEIEQYEKDIDKKVESAKADIYAAKENEIDGLKTACDDATHLLAYKAYVINNGRNFLDTKCKEIDDKANLTDDDKELLKQKMVDAVAEFEKGITASDNIRPDMENESIKLYKAAEFVLKQADAMAEINVDVADKKQAVNDMEFLTDEQKADLVKEIEQAKLDAFDVIDDATDADVLDAVVTKTLHYNELAVVKAKAIDTVMSQKALTDADKEAFIKNITELCAKAIEDINNTDATADNYSDLLDIIISDINVEIADEVDNAIALDFVKAYVADKNGEVYTSVTSENADQIASGEAAWETMTDVQKDKINALIAEANKDVDDAPKSYEDFVVSVETFAEASANDFIKNYLTGTDGEIFKEADKDNYKQILSGLSTWDKLSQTEKDAINAKLVANGGKTYEELLKVAQELEKSPQTGDDSNVALWICLMMIALAGIVLTYRKVALMSK